MTNASASTASRTTEKTATRGSDGRDIFSVVDHVSRFSGLAVGQFYLICVLATVWEVFTRYVLNAPTSWAFEVVLVSCATGWLISGGYVTLKKRHIGITVIYLMASDRMQWRLDVFAMVIGIFGLTFLLDDSLTRALTSIGITERTGSAFNSPLPLVLKSVLSLGTFLFLSQLLVNLWRHFENRIAKAVVLTVGMIIYLRTGFVFVGHFGLDIMLVEAVNNGITNFGEAINPQNFIDAQSADLGLVTFLMVGALILLMMTGMPLGLVTLFVAIMTSLIFFGVNGLYLVSSNAFGLTEKYALVAIPLFVLMASILERAGIARDLFDAMSVFAGNLRGGVAVQTTVVAVILAAMSGVLGGEIVMLGMVALPQMLRLGYDAKMVIGVICASGTLATLIPPSIVMIVYGLSANVGIGDLFLGGFLPGLMLATFYAGYVLVRCHLNPSLAPTAAEAAAKSGESTELSGSKKLAVGMCIFLITCVMGSIYAGVASVTEAAGVGVVGAMVVAAVRKKLTWTMFQRALQNTTFTVSTIFWLVIGAVAFVGIYNLIGGASYMRSIFAGLDWPPLAIILSAMAVLVVLGTFMDWVSIVFLTVPVFAPVIRDLAPRLGMEPDAAALWFGVLFVINVQISFLSPPFGPACFWLKSVAPPQISLHQIFVGVLPFIVLQIIGLALVVIFPEIALFLPRVLGG
ncbi:MAG: TRAP transporter large permease subunit [Rhodospirillales bacterium]|nr:TRAP transporter large permease subunit [Rhodospirillales bacterium]